MSREYLRMPSYVHTFTGRFVDPLDLKPEDVCIEDIAAHLSKQCRWTGACREFYSVAQHAVLCSRIVSAEQAWNALHHDDAEAYLQDMAKPLKNHPTLGSAYRGAEQRIERVIGAVFGVAFPLPPEVKRADEIMLVTEARDIVHGREQWAGYQDTPYADFTIKPWGPRRAEREFLKRYEALKP